MRNNKCKSSQSKHFNILSILFLLRFFFSAIDWLTLNCGFPTVSFCSSCRLFMMCCVSLLHSGFFFLADCLLLHLIELINGTFHIHHLPGCIFFISLFLSPLCICINLSTVIHPTPAPAPTPTPAPTPNVATLLCWLQLHCVQLRVFRRESFLYLRFTFSSFSPFFPFSFFFRHESTNCKIQLKIVECKLISALGYANYAANESPSSADIYTFTPIIVSI